MPQVLLIFDPIQAGEGISRVGWLATVTQVLPPRLAIVEVDPDRLAAVRGIPGVVAMFEGSVPDTMRAQLNTTELLFAEAWAKNREPKKDRVGEGLSWDAEGFEPPDRKPDRKEDT